MKRLVLFDIDGTLLNGGRLWREIFEGAFAAVFPGVAFPKVPFSGKTDRQICAEVFEIAGLARDSSDELEGLIDRLLDEYLCILDRTLATDRKAEVELLPGVLPLLEALVATDGVHLGLLTGNVRRGAHLKLQAVGLHGYFRTPAAAGAFGDDHADRYELPSIAVRRVRDETGLSYSGKEVVIIGDTPHDVACGRSINVRSIAVATGRPEYRQALVESRPDFFFEKLEPVGEVLRAIASPVTAK